MKNLKISSQVKFEKLKTWLDLKFIIEIIKTWPNLLMIFGRVRNVSLNERIKLAWKKDEQQSSLKSTKKGPNFIENLCDSYAQCGIQSDIPLLLRKLFNALNCIPPNSVESERAFSITGQFATKLCTKLDDDTLSSLVFFKAFYKNEAPN